MSHIPFSAKAIKLFVERIPSYRDIFAVYGVIVFLVYTWALYISFYKFPSWVYYLTVWEIVSVYAYAFTASLIDSFVVMVVVLSLDFFLFFFFRQMEEAQSRMILLSVTILTFIVVRLYLYGGYDDTEVFLSTQLIWYWSAIMLGVPLAIVFSKLSSSRLIVEKIAETLSVFMYVYLPISFVSVAIVLIRNIN